MCRKHGRRMRHRRTPNREDLLRSLEERQKDLEQEIADIHDLVRRLLALAMSLRSEAGFRVSPEVPGVDLRWFEFLYELGAIAARGEDIRDRVFERAA